MGRPWVAKIFHVTIRICELILVEKVVGTLVMEPNRITPRFGSEARTCPGHMSLSPSYLHPALLPVPSHYIINTLSGYMRESNLALFLFCVQTLGQNCCSGQFLTLIMLKSSI